MLGRPRRINKVMSDTGEHLEIDVSTKKHPRSTMLIDYDDWNAICKLDRGGIYASLEGARNKTPYAAFNMDGKKIRVHRCLFPKFERVFHLNENGLDNRRKNLRAQPHVCVVCCWD